VSLNQIITFFIEKNHQKGWRIVFWLNTLLLLYLTLSKPTGLGIGIDHIDKLFHLVGFAAFAFFLYLGYPHLKSLRVVLISLALGILVEIIQSILPYRSFDLFDLAADFIGIAAAVLIVNKAQIYIEDS